MSEYRPLLDIWVEAAEKNGYDLTLHDGETLGWKVVRPDFTTRNGFRWPFPGGAISATNPTEHPDPCPQHDGDGLCLAKTASGAASGGIRLHTVILVAWTGLLAESDDKLRVTICRTLAVVDAQRAYLREAYLGGAYLGGAYLRGAYLDGAYLGGADLRGAYLDGAYLGGADLRGANLYGAYLYGANLYGANLYGANLYGADLGGAYLYGANLYGANLYGANLYGADLYGADLGGADLGGAYGSSVCGRIVDGKLVS